MTDLRRALGELSSELEHPPTPDLANAVAARLRAVPPRRTPQRTRRIALVIVLALVLPAGAFAAVGPVRDAVLDALGIAGVKAQRIPAPVRVPPGAELDLGRRVSAQRAADLVDFGVVTADAQLGPPGATYVRSSPPGGALTLVYGTRAGERLLLTEFRGTQATEFIFKGLGRGTSAERVSVNGEPAVWLSGRPHQVAFLDARGRVQTDSLKLAGNTLLWQRGPLTLRLEGATSKATALGVAHRVG